MKKRLNSKIPGLSRREFLKVAGLSASSALLLSAGCSAAPFGFLSVGAIPGPLLRSNNWADDLQPLSWSDAERALAAILKSVRPSEIAFLMPPNPSHYYHFSQLLGDALGGAAVVCCDPDADLNGQTALLDASRGLFGNPQLPLFDFSAADLIFSFGANFQEPWIISPSVDKSEKFCLELSADARIVQFSARRPDHLGNQIEWIPIRPGSEGQLAAALYSQISEILGCTHQDDYVDADWTNSVCEAGIDPETIKHLAVRFVRAANPLALPGWAALTGSAAVLAGSWILRLNMLAKTRPSQERHVLAAACSNLSSAQEPTCCGSRN